MASERARYEPYARQAAQRQGINPDIFVRQITQESGWDPNAGSWAGAQGIAQIVPKYHPGVNPWDPVASLDYAANWMRELLGIYGGDWWAALVHYNGGGGAVAEWEAGRPYSETRAYLNAILGSVYPPTGQQPQPPAPPSSGGNGSGSAPKVDIPVIGPIVEPIVNAVGGNGVLVAILLVGALLVLED